MVGRRLRAPVGGRRPANHPLEAARTPMRPTENHYSFHISFLTGGHITHSKPQRSPPFSPPMSCSTHMSTRSGPVQARKAGIQPHQGRQNMLYPYLQNPAGAWRRFADNLVRATVTRGADCGAGLLMLARQLDLDLYTCCCFALGL